MSFFHPKFTPISTLLGLMFGTIIFATAAYDYRNRTRIRDILLNSIYSSNILMQSNNYNLLAVNLQSLNLLYGSCAEPHRFGVLVLMYLTILLVFAIIYWINAFLDLDLIQAQALKYALSLSGRTLHGLKTHMIQADQLYHILTQEKFPLTDEPIESFADAFNQRNKSRT